MGEYVTRCDIAINGEAMKDVKNFKRGEIIDAIQVALMNSTGDAGITPRHQFTVDYVIPSGKRFNWRAVKNATVIVSMEDGDPLEFYGVRCGKRGEYSLDDEKEAVQTITLYAQRASDDEAA